jgi:hypothetical protein
MTTERDTIIDAIADFKKVAMRRKKTTDWEKVALDLRAIFAELALATSPVLRGRSGETYHRRGEPAASITEARELLSGAKKALAAAKSLPTVLANFAVRTFGSVGPTSISGEVVKAYTDALAELELCLDSLEDMFKETLSKAGNPKGMKGPLLERVIGTPVEHFLQRLIRLWQEATGSRVLGKSFEDIAWRLIEATLPDDDSGDRPKFRELKRQIENARRRGEVVQTPWTYKTEVTHKLMKRPNVVRRRPR